MKKFVKVKIDNSNTFNIVNLLVKNNMYYKNINFFDNYITIDTDIKNIKKLKHIFKKIKIIKYYGIFNIIVFFNKYYISIICAFLSLIIIYILSFVIFEVNIETENKELKNIIKQELNNNNIKKYKFKKSFDKLNIIEKNIIKNNKDKIEWLEIIENGTTYNIKVTKRKLNKQVKKSGIQDIISTKDAIIKKIIYKRGVALKEVNDYVKKGEVIITGNIIKGEDELKDQVSAQGIVYGEVWYVVNISVPYKYKYLKKVKEFNRYYITIFDKEMTIYNYYKNNNYKTTNKLVLDKVYLPFKLYKENVMVYEYKTKFLNRNETYNYALKRSINKIKSTLDSDEYILSKKVLKKSAFRSRIELEVFIKTYENITGTSKLNVLQKGSVKSDT